MLTAFTSSALKPTNARSPWRTNSSGLPQLRISTLSFRGRNLTHCFSQIPKSSAHASGAGRHSHPLVPITIWDFILTSVNDASSLRAHEHLRSCLHQLTHALNRKVLILTKPKGKIYKRKSLCNYITYILSYVYIFIAFFSSKTLFVRQKFKVSVVVSLPISRNFHCWIDNTLNNTN